MCGSATHDDPLDWLFAPFARFGFAAVDAVEVLEIAGVAGGVAVVAEGAATMFEGALQRQLDRFGEGCDLNAGQFMRRGFGVDASFEKGFVDVDVPQAGDQALVEQGVFDGAGGGGKSLGELRGADLQWLGADLFGFGLGMAEPPDSAEAARIGEADLSAGGLLERDPQMGVGFQFVGHRVHSKSTAHSQMDVKAIPVVERENDALGAAFDALDSMANQVRFERKFRGREDVAPSENDAGDSLACDDGSKRINNGLDFRKLGHR
jgi:hypothetical protein